MNKMKSKNELLEKIESAKEILSTMPQNNQKNRNIYQTEIQNVKEEYEKYEKDIIKELRKRYEEYIRIEPNEKIENLERQYKEIKRNLYLLNEIMTSYERMGLDKIIYKLDKFYKENLESINQEILNAIQKYKEVGITLSYDDFEYSPYVKEYMQVFLEEVKEDINSKVLKEKFEEIYWKCPEIVAHIKLNLLHIYMEKENIIDKYYLNEKENFLKPLKLDDKQVKDRYFKIQENMIELEKIDQYIILHDFLEGRLNISDYTDEKLNSSYSKITTGETEITKEHIVEISNDLFKFRNSLYELKNYDKFKFIIENIKSHYLEKVSYKNLYNINKKDIAKREKQLEKLNKQVQGKGLFGSKKIDVRKSEYTETILELGKLYKELYRNRVFHRIYSNLSDNSSLYDILQYASSFNNYLITCMIENNKEITMEEIEEQIEELKQFLEYPYNTMIHNVTILEEKDIKMIIKDRYKLLSFEITIEDLDIDNIPNLMNNLEIIEKGINIRNAGLEVGDIENTCKLQKILNEK